MNTQKQLRFNSAHLMRMVDDTGILRHAIYDVPNLKEGYATDDNARLLMVAALCYDHTGDERFLALAYRALSFLGYAEKGGWFQNFMRYDRRFVDAEASQECYGRCIWALGTIAGRSTLPQGLRAAAEILLQKTAPAAAGLTQLRANAYAALGLAGWEHPARAQTLAEQLARVAAAYHGKAGPNWFWYEEEITYCNAVLPHALLAGTEVLGSKGLLDIGLESLDFLLQETTRESFFWPIGCNGWSRRGHPPALYDQQPVEACATLMACLTAHRLTQKDVYLEKAQLCHDWFLGANSAAVPMVDESSGGCYDSLRQDGPEPNQGAESLLSWITASLCLQTYKARVQES